MVLIVTCDFPKRLRALQLLSTVTSYCCFIDWFEFDIYYESDALAIDCAAL